MNKRARLCLLLVVIFGMIPHSCIASEDDQRPPEHLCPLTLSVMVDPVVTADGQSYEREAILRYFDVNDAKSPNTGVLLKNKDICDNLALKTIVSDRRPERQTIYFDTDAVHSSLISDIVIPDIARGYEEIYRRFLNGKLIYKPDPKSDTGRIEFSFRALANPLEGTFDLSRCENSEQRLSISTGYRKAKKAENANKVEIWICPRFLIEKNLASSAAHFKPIMSNWNVASAPVGVFWTWGGWDDPGTFDYLTTNSLEALGSDNLFEKYIGLGSRAERRICARGRRSAMSSCFLFELK